MTSKEIIIKLIDEKLINGEEAYILINDILKAEMVVVNQTLKEIEISRLDRNNPYEYPKVTWEPCVTAQTNNNTAKLNQ